VGLAWWIISRGTRPGEAHSLLRAWCWWEQLARQVWPVHEIPDAPFGLLCFRIRRYLGEMVMLPDATRVAPGALVGELHCNNRTVLALAKQGGNPFVACREDFRSLSIWIQQDWLARQIEAFYACTILTKAARRLGFIVREQPVTVRRRLEKLFFKGLLFLYSQEGLARIQHGSTPHTYPAEVWLSRRQFLQIYCADHKSGRSAAVGLGSEQK
jgi:hypothetical protein